MPTISSITIQNLRGLENVTLDDTRVFNLIVGPSEIGKTTVLEGILIASGIVDLHKMVSVNQIRGAHVDGKNRFLSAVASLYRNWSDEPICFDVAAREPSCGIAYRYDASLRKQYDDQSVVVLPSNGNYSDSKDTNLFEILAHINVRGDFKGAVTRTLALEEHADGDRVKVGIKHTDPIRFNGQEPAGEIGEIAAHSPNCVYCFPLILADAVNSAIRTLRKDVIILELQRVNSKITDFAVLDGEVHLRLKDKNDQMVGLYTSGGGISEILLTLCTLTLPHGSIFLFDEIGKNLYYASMGNYLRAVLHAAKQQGKQIFATTHNKDVLLALREVAKADPELQDDVACYSLSRTRHGNVKAYRYGYDVLEDSVEIR